MAADRPLDVKRLIGEVAARHNILLRPDDAAFALVTINRLVLEEVAAGLVGEVRGLIAEFEQAASQVQIRAGGLIARDVKEATAAILRELSRDAAAGGKRAEELVEAVHRAHSRTARERWMAVGAACALLLFFSGILVGRMLK